MKLEQAREIAERWVELMRPECERIEIAGSVRRLKPEVHDIEICAVPKLRTEADMFGNPAAEISALDDVIDIMQSEGSIIILKGGSKYKQIALPEAINIDLFIVTYPAQWGVIDVIRTGPAEFSHWIVTARQAGGGLPSNAKVKDGAVWIDRKIIAMPEERDFFKFCGMPWIEPKDRAAWWGGFAPMTNSTSKHNFH